MNLILRSASMGLLWGVVFAASVVLAQPAHAGGWRDGGAWQGYDDERHYGGHEGVGYGGYRDDDHYDDVDYRGGYGGRYGYGDRYGYDRDRDARWFDDGRYGAWGGDRGRHAGRVWCPQRRAYVLPWEVRGWRGHRHDRWRHRDRHRHWRSW